MPPLTPQRLEGRPISASIRPRRLILIRLQAFGDTVITLPALAGLRNALPECRIEVVTDVRSAALFEALTPVDRVWSFDARAEHLARGVAVLRLVKAIAASPLDAVIDLQRCRWSRLMTALLRPPAFVRYDRTAPRTALTRYLEAFAWLGLPRLEPVLQPHVRPEALVRGDRLLLEARRDPSRPLVCLNPAGGWPTKQWPIERFVALGRRLVDEAGAQLVLLGAGAMEGRVSALRKGLGRSSETTPAPRDAGRGSPDLLELVGKTGPAEAMAIVSRLDLMVSEDSGLMHLAWTQGRPTLALFGSTRWTWSRPEGPRVDGFYSEDLSCGACMQPTCARGDLHCLSRVEVGAVMERAARMLSSRG